MRRREFITLLAGSAAAIALPSSSIAQNRVWRIGTLETVSAARKPQDIAAFRQALQALGYVEGQNLKIEYQSADGHPERFPALAQQLVSQHVDVITTRGTPAIFAAKDATATIPIVMTAVGDPLLMVASLAHRHTAANVSPLIKARYATRLFKSAAKKSSLQRKADVVYR